MKKKKEILLLMGWLFTSLCFAQMDLNSAKYFNVDNNREPSIKGFSSPQNVIIKGRISKYRQKKNKIQIKFSEFVPFTKHEIDIEIKSDGSFYTSFLKYYTQDIKLIYDKEILFLAGPGDTIYIDIESPKRNTTFYGNNADINNTIQAYYQGFDDKVSNIFCYQFARGKDAFLKYIQSRYKEEINWYDKFKLSYITHPLFDKWIKMKIQYLYGFKMNFIEELYQPIFECDLTNPEAIMSSEYFNYFDWYVDFCKAEGRNIFKDSSEEEFGYLCKTLNGFARDYALSERMYIYSWRDYFDDVLALLQKYNAIVENKYLKEKINRTINKKDSIIFKSALPTGNDLLTQIKQDNPEKLIFLCLVTNQSESIASLFDCEELLKKINSNRISLVYVCSKSAYEFFEFYLKNKHRYLSGKFYVANPKQEYDFRKALDARTFPKFCIIEKDGTISKISNVNYLLTLQ